MKEGLLERRDTASDVWTHTMYRSKKPLRGLHGKAWPCFKNPSQGHAPRYQEIQCGKASEPFAGRPGFAGQKSQMALVIRTMRITSATMRIRLANMVSISSCRGSARLTGNLGHNISRVAFSVEQKHVREIINIYYVFFE